MFAGDILGGQPRPKLWGLIFNEPARYVWIIHCLLSRYQGGKVARKDGSAVG